jgi:putative salt-induced outer membrane protein
MKLTFTKPSVFKSLLLISALSSSANIYAQEDSQLIKGDAKTVEQLSAEIQLLTEQLDKITGNIENFDAQVEDSAEISADIPAAVADVEEEIKIWTGDFEFGYNALDGNTNETIVNAKANIDREQNNWLYRIIFDAQNSETDGNSSAERYLLSNRLGYELKENHYVFGYASYEDDRFSGFDYQMTASLGYGRRYLDTDTMQWDVEVGPGFRQNKVADGVDGDDTEEVIIRAYTKYVWGFSDDAEFGQEVNVEGGADNTISTSITSVKFEVIGSVSVKFSYRIKYTDVVPSGTDHADTETAVTLTYSL